jgi:hypothetical protein
LNKRDVPTTKEKLDKRDEWPLFAGEVGLRAVVQVLALSGRIGLAWE